jgi:Na+/phosphate symporter
MKIKTNILAVTAVVAVCASLVWLCTSIQGGEKKYEVHPYITIPEYRTDAARAIDAYERLMERQMDLTEKNLIAIKTNLKEIAGKLDSIDAKLTELSARIGKIEKALRIEPSEEPKEKTACPEKTKEHFFKKSAPPG